MIPKLIPFNHHLTFFFLSTLALKIIINKFFQKNFNTIFFMKNIKKRVKTIFFLIIFFFKITTKLLSLGHQFTFYFLPVICLGISPIYGLMRAPTSELFLDSVCVSFMENVNQHHAVVVKCIKDKKKFVIKSQKNSEQYCKTEKMT